MYLKYIFMQKALANGNDSKARLPVVGVKRYNLYIKLTSLFGLIRLLVGRWTDRRLGATSSDI